MEMRSWKLWQTAWQSFSVPCNGALVISQMLWRPAADCSAAGVFCYGKLVMAGGADFKFDEKRKG